MSETRVEVTLSATVRLNDEEWAELNDDARESLAPDLREDLRVVNDEALRILERRLQGATVAERYIRDCEVDEATVESSWTEEG